MNSKFAWTVGAAAMALMAVSGGAQAQAQEAGKWQFKLLGTAVLPDGKITSVKKDTANVTPGAQSKANDNITPTIAIEYFVTPNISVETIAGLTQHDVDGRGTLGGTELIADAKILPATVTLKYHADLGVVKPYIGAGPSYFIFIDEKSGATTKTLGLTKARLNDKFGGVIQAGVDVPLGSQGFGLSLDAKRYFLRTSAHWFDANGVEQLTTRHKLDPWVLSAGISYRF
ncbi:MAG: OmpW family protein [Sphingobium sp.]|nr:OmpW family protein [Sphingobium sp.]